VSSAVDTEQQPPAEPDQAPEPGRWRTAFREFAAGSVLSGGLGGLLNQLQQNGHGETANSWVGKGPNQNISESDLAKSIGSEDIDMLARHTGMSRDELLSGLSRELPGAIDELTPDGRVPTADEASRWV